eukprot:2977807-Amphidinium_carterae.1
MSRILNRNATRWLLSCSCHRSLLCGGAPPSLTETGPMKARCCMSRFPCKQNSSLSQEVFEAWHVFLASRSASLQDQSLYQEQSIEPRCFLFGAFALCSLLWKASILVNGLGVLATSARGAPRKVSVSTRLSAAWDSGVLGSYLGHHIASHHMSSHHIVSYVYPALSSLPYIAMLLQPQL